MHLQRLWLNSAIDCKIHVIHDHVFRSATEYFEDMHVLINWSTSSGPVNACVRSAVVLTCVLNFIMHGGDTMSMNMNIKSET